ncbi:MAG: DUF2905 domain-containing protein [Chitinispirillales bacterium]|jgi:hypothetical protein|nr:DUF2905 domain-containing protein [Chitinispirillales bacterium]
MNLVESGKFLVTAGTVIIIIGLLFMLSDKIPLGRLPGDFHVGSGRFRVYIPIATSLFLSLALTIIFNFFARK